MYDFVQWDIYSVIIFHIQIGNSISPFASTYLGISLYQTKKIVTSCSYSNARLGGRCVGYVLTVRRLTRCGKPYSSDKTMSLYSKGK
jgi:hypothetical protein